jgi:hypothetical protein
MLSQTRVSAAKSRQHYATQATRIDPDAAVLQLAGPVRGEHVLIMGGSALEVMCALQRKGASEVTLLRQGVRPEQHTADLVIAAAVASLEHAASAMAHATRALTESGRIILRTVADPTGRLAQAIARMFRLQGFSGVRVRPTGEGALVVGSRPFFGPVVHT